ncbi:MAG: SGNH hydrolase domain-containing protein [Xanthobacteraceae bacterium]
MLLSSVFRQYINDKPRSFLIDDRIVAPDTALVSERLLQTVAALHAAGKRVLIIAPPPSLGTNVNLGDCLERRARGLFVFLSALGSCDFSYDKYLAAWEPIIGVLNDVGKKGAVEIIWPADALCPDKKTCMTQIGDTYLYRDEGHITYDGSVLLADRLKFRKLLNAE